MWNPPKKIVENLWRGKDSTDEVLSQTMQQVAQKLKRKTILLTENNKKYSKYETQTILVNDSVWRK